VIATLTSTSFADVRRESWLVCDRCGARTAAVEIGTSAADADAARAFLRGKSGFVEIGRDPWKAGAAPEKIGDGAIQDVCAECAPKPMEPSP
jgi:hypothetical protein